MISLHDREIPCFPRQHRIGEHGRILLATNIVWKLIVTINSNVCYLITEQYCKEEKSQFSASDDLLGRRLEKSLAHHSGL
jgi:hypothetical protein